MSYKIGDLVSVMYCHVEKEQLRFRQHMGIITDSGGDEGFNGHRGMRRSFKVLTVDGKHDWSPRGDLTLLKSLE